MFAWKWLFAVMAISGVATTVVGADEPKDLQEAIRSRLRTKERPATEPGIRSIVPGAKEQVLFPDTIPQRKASDIESLKSTPQPSKNPVKDRVFEQILAGKPDAAKVEELSKPVATESKPTAEKSSPAAPLSKQRRERRAKWNNALQAPANLTVDAGESLTLGELLQRVQQQHGLPVRIDLPHVLPMASMAEMTMVRLTPKRSGNQTVTLPPVSGLLPYAGPPTYAPSPAGGSTYYAPDVAYPTPGPERLLDRSGNLPPAVTPLPADAPPQRPAVAYKPAALSEDAEEEAAPVSAIQAEVISESTEKIPPATLSKPTAKSDTNDEKESDRNDAGKLVQLMLGELLKTPVDNALITQTEATVEDVLRQAFDRSFPLQALLNASLSEEVPMLTSLSRATEWDLLVQDDGVLLTTRLNANLHKETRVYSTRNLEKTASLKAEDVARVLTRTVRPWSWKKNFPEAVTAAKPAKEAKPATKTGAKISVPKIDLSMLGLLLSSRSMLPQHIRLASDEVLNATGVPASTAENVELTEEQLELLGRAWDGLFQVAVSSIQVIYHADPPTGVIEVLPGMLVISQSQSAHREIADLLEQLSQPEN